MKKKTKLKVSKDKTLEIHIYHFDIHECPELEKMEGVQVVKKSYNDFWDLAYEWKMFLEIDYCPYCGVKLEEEN